MTGTWKEYNNMKVYDSLAILSSDDTSTVNTKPWRCTDASLNAYTKVRFERNQGWGHYYQKYTNFTFYPTSEALADFDATDFQYTSICTPTQTVRRGFDTTKQKYMNYYDLTIVNETETAYTINSFKATKPIRREDNVELQILAVVMYLESTVTIEPHESRSFTITLEPDGNEI